MNSGNKPLIHDMIGPERDLAIPIVKEGFVGIYRWHAKRTLRSIERVRGLWLSGKLAGVSMLVMLTPEVGYVYYIAVGKEYRRRGIGGMLVDDAIACFKKAGARIIYAAAEDDNAPSLALMVSRGLRVIEREEMNYKDGGLGAWGLRSRMMLVSGEVLMGKKL